MTLPDPQAAPYRNFIRDIRSLVRKRLPDGDAAEDVLQEVLFKSVAARPASGPRDPAAWLRRIARNAVADFYRTRAARRRREDRYAREAETIVPAADEAPPSPCRCVTPVLSSLRPGHAAALRAVDRDGRNPADVAREQGVSPGNLAVRLHRARAALKKRVLATCGDCARHGCGDCDCGTADTGALPLAATDR